MVLFDGATDSTTNYNYGAGDVAGATIIVTLTSTAQGLCKPVSDTLTITVVDSPGSDIGTDSIQVCGDITDLIVMGTITDNPTGGYWASFRFWFIY